MTKRDLINLLEVKKDSYTNAKKKAYDNLDAANATYYFGAIDALEYALSLVKDLEESQPGDVVQSIEIGAL